MLAIKSIISVPFFSTKIVTRSIRGNPRRLPQDAITFRVPEPQPEPVTPKERTKVEKKASKEKKPRTFRQYVKGLKYQNSRQEVTIDNQHKIVRGAVAMFHDIPYETQLQMKQRKHEELLERLSKNKNVRPQMKQGQVKDIIQSPVITNYRNKDKMSVGLGVNGDLAVGFFASSKAVCVVPDSIDIIRDSHKQVARFYTGFLTDHVSRNNIWMYLGQARGWSSQGWGEIMVRSNYKGELMIKVSYNVNDTNKACPEAEKVKLLEVFSKSGLTIKSLYICEQSWVWKTRQNKLIAGDEFLKEKIGDVSIFLGPDTFCQGNTPVAERMVQVVRNTLETEQRKTLLDLCCGAGMFSLALAEEFRGAVGIDQEDTRVASLNAELNGLTNTRYLTGSIESHIVGITHDLRSVGATASAILNPGRSGVPQNLIINLRRFQMLDSLIYISCQPEDERGFKNLMLLMSPDRPNTPSRFKSDPFKLVDSIPLDMFPHTHHCEHLFVFKR